MAMSNPMKDFLPQVMRKAILIFFIGNILTVIFQTIFPFGLFLTGLNCDLGMFCYHGLAKPILLQALYGFTLYSIALVLYRLKLILALIYITVVNVNFLLQSFPHSSPNILWLLSPLSSVGIFTKLLITYYLIQTLMVILAIFIVLKNYLNKSKKLEKKNH